MKTTKIQTLLYIITLLISVLILVDFIVPGNTYTQKIINVKKKKQQYYNAAQNYHYSYKVKTEDHQFSVSEQFAKTITTQNIKYSVSIFFKEINKFQLQTSKKSHTYSFRIVSGLVLPLIVIITIAVAYYRQKRYNTLLFVLQVILIANLIKLLL